MHYLITAACDIQISWEEILDSVTHAWDAEMFDFSFEHPSAFLRNGYASGYLIVHSADEHIFNMAWINAHFIVSACDDEGVEMALIDGDVLVAVDYILVDLATPIMHYILKVHAIESSVRQEVRVWERR